jgi:hypothetical protein
MPEMDGVDLSAFWPAYSMLVVEDACDDIMVHTNFRYISNVLFRHGFHQIKNFCYLLWIRWTLNDVCGETKTRQDKAP